MSWKKEIEQILKDQMPYAYGPHGARAVVNDEMFHEAMGYVLDFVEQQRKKEFMLGFATGVIDAKAYNELDIQCSTFWAEKSWQRKENV